MNTLFKKTHIREKVYITPELCGGVYFTLRTMKQSNLPPELSKTIQITPWVVSDGGFTAVTMVLLQ